ncbi:type I restriction enzyme HsdR N-terminal domain-containing protein [Candidatus Sumerlaeota bacterium]|nr:type I restriction enzyme HsdR N-terminal domain-containing protein [Candidatus Sumerlaeota bacterium]
MNIENDLLQIQDDIKKYIDSGQAEKMTETETRRLLIDPLITALGWDIKDLECVRQGWRGAKSAGEQKEADYALFLKGKKKPSIIIEAKRFQANLSDKKTQTQTVLYAFLNGVEWCMLTNGHQIIVFYAFDKKDINERLLFDPIDLELLNTPDGLPVKTAADLLGMFTPNSIEDGIPNKYRENHKIRAKVFYCLDEMLRQSDKSLVSLIRKRLDYEFKPHQIAECLKGFSLSKKGVEPPPSPPEDDWKKWHLEKGCGPESRNLLLELDEIIRNNFDADGPNWNHKRYVSYRLGKKWNWISITTFLNMLKVEILVKTGSFNQSEIADKLGLAQFSEGLSLSDVFKLPSSVRIKELNKTSSRIILRFKKDYQLNRKAFLDFLKDARRNFPKSVKQK